MNKKSVEERIAEFIPYHINGDGECNNVVLKAYADRHKLTENQRFELAFFFAITYCVGSALILFRDRFRIVDDPVGYARENKDRLIFQSDRKYVKMRDTFEKLLVFYQTDIYDHREAILRSITDKGVIILSKAIPYVERWFYFGRFATFLYLETLVALLGLGFENTSIDWRNGDTATSGMLNLHGLDNSANAFDKTNKLPNNLSTETMDEWLRSLQEQIKAVGGDYLTTDVETSLCAYRKLYKGSRYNGFYLDRMLEEIYAMKQAEPELMKELLVIRSKTCNHDYLGEIGGWQGIRPEMKKYYLKTGKIN